VIALVYYRAKALRWAWTVLLLAGGVWFAQVHRPAEQALSAREDGLAQREARVRQARAAVVAHGPAGLDSALTRFRADSALLALRVPPDTLARALASEVKAIVGAREGRGLRIVRTDPIAPSAEGGFLVAGYTVTAVGRYAAVRGLLADLAAQPRLLRVRRLRMTAIPDSMVAGASAPGGRPGLPLDTAVVADRLTAAAAEPFEVVVTFQAVWYTRSSAASAAPDLSPGGAVTPSPGLLP
jgi:hypothetical protein